MMRLRTHLVATTMLAIAGAGGLASPALAQATSEQTGHQPGTGDARTQTGAPSATQSQGLGDIVVTAQRQSENSQRAALPLNVLEGGALRAAGITQVDRLGTLAPALAIEPTNTGTLIFVRGVGNFTLTANSDPAIAFNYDGVYVGRPTSTTGVFYDLDRVEVLKGPQGILYGRNATAGAINVLPAQPKLGELSGYGSVAYGNYNTVQSEGAVNLPMGDNGAARISFSRSSHDGYLSDGTSDENTWAGRVQLKAKLTPDLTVRVSGDYARNSGAGTGIDYVGVYGGSPNNFIPSNIPAGTGITAPSSQAFYTGLTFAPLGNHLPPLPDQFQRNKFYGANAEIDYQTGIGTFTVIPAWRNARLNYLADAGAIPYYDREDDVQYSVEARFAGKRIGPVDYQVGGYYFNEDIHDQVEVNNSNLTTHQLQVFRTESYAGFGRLTFHVSDRLRLVGGARYTHDAKEFSNDRVSAIIVCTVFVAGRPSCPLAPVTPLFNGDPSTLGFPLAPNDHGVRPIFANGVYTGAISIRSNANVDKLPLNNQKVTYRAGVEFDIAPRSLLYASFETGYRSGGFSDAIGYESYQPETITAYTIGMKNRFLGNRVQLNVEGFLWNYKNQQVTHVGPDTSGQTSYFTQNIGSSRIEGAEIDGKVLVTPTTLVGGDLQYLHTRQRDFSYVQAAGTPPYVGCPTSGGSATTPYAINCSGLPSYNSPKWTLNLSGQKTVELSPYKFVFTVDSQYRTSRYIGFAYLVQQHVGATWTTNAQIQFGPDSEKWTIAGFVRNIENDRIPVYSQQGGTNGILVETTSAPRTYGVRVSAKF